MGNSLTVSTHSDQKQNKTGLSSGQLKDLANMGSGWCEAEMGVEQRALLRQRIKMKR